MGILTRSNNPAENPETRLTGGLLLNILEEHGTSSISGKSITPKKSMQLIAVYRAVTMVSGLIASLPIKTFRRAEDGSQDDVFVPLLAEPTRGMTAFELKELLAGHLALSGNFDAFKVYDDSGEQVVELLPYRIGRVEYDREKPSPENPSGRLYKILDKNGTTQSVLTDREVFHIPLFSLDGFVGLSPIQAAKEAIAGGLSAEEFANKLWNSGILTQGILTTPQRLKEEQAKRLKERWKSRATGLDKAYDIAVLDADTKYEQLSLSPSDAQFLEERKFTVAEIARLYGLPPHLLSQQERQTSWGTGIEQHNIGFVVYTLNPVWLNRIESRLELLTPGTPGDPNQVQVEFQVQGLMRGDSKTRATFYTKMASVGAMTPNEIRKLENLPPIEGGDEILPPSQVTISEDDDDEEGSEADQE